MVVWVTRPVNDFTLATRPPATASTLLAIDAAKSEPGRRGSVTLPRGMETGLALVPPAPPPVADPAGR